MRVRRVMATSAVCATLAIGLFAPAASAAHAPSALRTALPVPGASGAPVADLQRALIARGHPIPAGPTGFFGSQTRAAVAAFQRAQGWSGSGADGIPGPMTMQRLGLTGAGTPAPVPPVGLTPIPTTPPPAPSAPTPPVGADLPVPGSTGPAVAALQQALAARGHSWVGDATGSYGPATRAAVAAFQRAQGWTGSGADGVPGPQTMARLGLTAGPAAPPAPPVVRAPATPALALPPEQFVARYTPYAQRVSQATGVPALVNLAQAALESGWGSSAPGYNFFGIKSRPGDPEHTRQARITTEVLPTADSGAFADVVSVTPRADGRFDHAVRQWFRVYASPEESFLDHGEVLAARSWYAPAFQHRDDPYAFAAAIAAGGYATDPDYVPKLHRVMRLIESLQQAQGI